MHATIQCRIFISSRLTANSKKHVLRDKLTAVAERVKKLAVVFGSPEFVTVLATVRHWALSSVTESTVGSVINWGLLLGPSIFLRILF